MSDSDFSTKRTIDAVCDDFENAWSENNRPEIEKYLERIEDEHRIALLEQLLAIDVELRHKAELGILPKDYQHLGEAAVAKVQQLLNGIQSTQSIEIDDHTLEFEAGPGGNSESFNSPPDEDATEEPPARQPVSELPKSIGRYQVESILGQGGFGLVYKAYDEQLQRSVAVKVPHADRVNRREDAEEYLTEARTVANLEHPNIVPVHDVGQSDEFPCYVVSRFIEGKDLSARIKQEPLSIGEAVELVATIAEALHYAHKQSLVHRDVKSGNILLGADGTPYLVDFGLALKERKVGTGAEYAGTPAYMSPEQARGEGHRVDGRSDIYSLGVVLYELLTGQRTFRADTARDLLKKITSLDVKPPRQINDNIPRELERICLKALSRRASDRYTTALDLADDLRHFLKIESAESLTETGILRDTGQEASSTKAGIDSATPPFDSDSREIRVVPKGLRSFDAHDADFFLELLPGPRDRDGLPDSIRFWKTKIEETDPDQTFSIGLIYGPSGCGKSSLVKAGLLPRLSEDVTPIYIEATPDETESRLLNGLRKACPILDPRLDLAILDPGLDLVESLTAVRQGRATPAGKKVLIVLDQFEQWLHAKKEEQNTVLVQALRQCDGEHLQCVVMVRDDFWLAVSRFLRDLEIRLVEGENSALADLFDLDHARKVLSAFGRAFGKLPAGLKETTSDQKQFIKQSVADLAEEGKVICVRLALFAEMMKGKSWTPDSLAEVGGTSGVGATFLEETFSASTAPPEHRYHQKAARAVLQALLPDSGTDIKGEMKSREELLEASGYASRPKDFDDLIRILDSEIRLITPADPEGFDSEDSKVQTETGRQYYQLTHDYLVHSLKDWLTRKQRETRQGRAELLLAERSATWNSKQEYRQLPSTLEWLRIHWLTSHGNWTPPQRKMMSRANRVKGLFWTAVIALIFISTLGIQQILSQMEQRTVLRNTKVAVESLQGAEGKAVPYALENLDKLPKSLVVVELKDRIAEAKGQQQLSLLYGLARYEQVEVDTLIDGLLSAESEPDEVDNIADALRHAETESLKKLNSGAATATTDKNWIIKARLAIVALYLGDNSLATEMLRDQPGTALPKVELPDLLSGYRKQVEQITALPEEQRNSASSRMTLSRAFYFLGEYDKALVELDQLASGESANWEDWLRRAVCQAHAGREQDSKKSLAELAKATRTESQVTYGQILVQAVLGNLGEAEKQLNQMIADSAKDSTAQYKAACIASQLLQICRREKLPDEAKFKKLTFQLLRTAYLDLGYKGSSGIDNDADFIPLHQEEDFLALVAEIKPPAITWDPIQRTVFIREFSAWSGSLSPLAEIVADSKSNAFRFGICLAVGGVKNPGQEAKDKWQPVLASWYTEATDNGTHSASGWALAQWSLETPEVSASRNPPLDRAWWHAPNGLRFVKINSGNVTGDNGPIRVQDDYWLGDTEITVGLFRQFMADEEYHARHPDLKPDWEGPAIFNNDDSDGLPVQQVSWYDALLFCNWLSEESGLDQSYEVKKKGTRDYEVKWNRSAKGIRLPTEAEWEYACRAATTTGFSFGDDEKDLLNYGWFGLNSNSRTHAVGEKRCNPWGLFDMHGNVYEWCSDLYSTQGSSRMYRGGSWFSTAWFCQSSLRYYEPKYRNYYLGFRVARGPSSQASERGSDGR